VSCFLKAISSETEMASFDSSVCSCFPEATSLEAERLASIVPLVLVYQKL
jgi:hypothetical protein